MERDRLKDFIFSENNRSIFIRDIEQETDRYNDCIKRRGSSCPIELTGDEKYEVSYNDILILDTYLRKKCSASVRDYILTGIQLDECIEKSAEVFDFLHDLTSAR